MSRHETTVYDEIAIDLGFEFTPGCRERGPTYDYGGQPAEAASVEATSFCLRFAHGSKVVEIKDGDLTVEARRNLAGWLEDRFGDEMESEVPTGPDPDEAYERAREDRMEDAQW